MADDPFAKYRAEHEQFDAERWPEAFSAVVRAAVETQAEAAAAAAYRAVRRVAELADGSGSVQEAAENAIAEDMEDLSREAQRWRDEGRD